MVKDKNNLPSYAEMFDGPRIMEICDMAYRWVMNRDFHGIPNGSFSDFECVAWEIVANTIRKATGKED